MAAGGSSRTTALKMCTGQDETVAEVVEEGGDDSVRRALTETAACVVLALVFCAGVYFTRGAVDAKDWLAAYLLEQSLSVDNLLVFSLIFDYFSTPISSQPRILRLGFIGAVVLRAACIFAGLAALEAFRPVLLVFAAILLWTAGGVLFNGGDEEEDVAESKVLQLVKSVVPYTDNYDGEDFFTQVDGKTLATPLLLALVCVEVSDVVFAVDSIPAVFGVTTDPFIALSSNAFALLGLRSVYVIVAKAVNEFEYLQSAIGIVLGFIGGKLVLSYNGVEIASDVSLVVVASALSIGIGASVWKGKSEGKDGDGETQ